ncbi:hypothetical protein OXIME_001524 [Oxyplasma meridianum]|uniref:Uncharacterized protein n=1 Tax=Oxyplasma meridianum TaxID=3073602 RepID=A0AAX4NIA0_9ARCH
MPINSADTQDKDQAIVLKWISYIFKVALESGVSKIDFSVIQKLLYLIQIEAEVHLNLDFQWDNKIPIISGFADIMKENFKNVRIRKKKDPDHKVIDKDSLVYFDLGSCENLPETLDIQTFPGVGTATRIIKKWIDSKSSDLLMYIIIFHENAMSDIVS